MGNPAACFVPAGEKSEAQKQEPVLGADGWLGSVRRETPCRAFKFNLSRGGLFSMWGGSSVIPSTVVGLSVVRGLHS